MRQCARLVAGTLCLLAFCGDWLVMPLAISHEVSPVFLFIKWRFMA
jgi:hypothetical protein